jgi:eukaryotic-like serine/threonine-protein kinase
VEVPEPTAATSEERSDAAQERAAALIGRTLSDRYRIVSLVAMGGMGSVYGAEHLLMRKHVAVKVLHPEIEGFPELVARFEREAVAGAHIEHPNVVTASDFGKFDNGSCFLVLEFIRGTTLRELMDRGPLPPKRAAWIVRQVAAGLAAVHAKGIVHRDIKPTNVMIIDETRRTRRIGRNDPGVEDVVKLIDFGLAKVPVEELSAVALDADDPRRSLTAAGVVMGTVGYLAPEAALGARAITAPADLYSLGVVFYEMLCGRTLFEGSDAAEIFTRHRSGAVPPLSERNPEVSVPPSVEAVVRRLLEKEPDARYPSASALIAAIDDAFTAMNPQPASRVTTPHTVDAAATTTGNARGKRTARRALWIGGLLAAAAAAALVVTTAGRSDQPGASGAASATAARAAAPAPSDAPRPAPPRAPGALQRLRAAADAEDGAKALAAVIDLADSEPAAFGDRAVQTEAAGLVEAAAAKGVVTDAIFDRLTGKLGTDGLDILYDLVAREHRAAEPLARAGITRPTGAGPTARAILGKAEVLARATPAMRIAYELRRSSCKQRIHLFPRAGVEGDDRALEILRSMQPPSCSRKDACCLGKHRALEHAIADIQARLRR